MSFPSRNSGDRTLQRFPQIWWFSEADLAEETSLNRRGKVLKEKETKLTNASSLSDLGEMSPGKRMMGAGIRSLLDSGCLRVGGGGAEVGRKKES